MRKVFLLLGVCCSIMMLFSCGNNSKQSSKAKTEQVSQWKGNETYKDGYTHGKKGRTLGTSSANEYCNGMSAMDASVPSVPSAAWKAGFNDGYNGKASQY